MAIYLVNQGKTYRIQREGGYIWSPKFNKAGNRNSGYSLMKSVRKGDFIIHNSGGKLSAISVVQNGCTPSREPIDLKVCQNEYEWNDDGWIVKTQYYDLRKPIPTADLVEWTKRNYKKESAFQTNGKLKPRYLCNLVGEHAEHILEEAMASETDIEVYRVLKTAFEMQKTNFEINIELDNEDLIREMGLKKTTGDSLKWREIGLNLPTKNILKGIQQIIDERIHEINNICQIIDRDRMGARELLSGWKHMTRILFLSEAHDYLLYIICSDGIISEVETDFLRKVTPYTYKDRSDPKAWKHYVENHNIFSVEFENKIPDILKIFIKYEELLYKREVSREDGFISKTLFDTYKIMGAAAIICDLQADENEVKEYTNYITNLYNYINNKSIYIKKGLESITLDIDEELKVFSALNKEQSNGLAVSRKKTQIVDDDLVDTDSHVFVTKKKQVKRSNEEQLEDVSCSYIEQGELINEPKYDSAESLEELLDQLNELVGLDAVKRDVNSLINLVKIRKLKEERGMQQIPMSLHLVFVGNPGTGKTTVARLLSKIYNRLGVLSKGHLIEVDRSGLVAGYVGQTALKVQEVIQKSLGGILFIDEAYSLTGNMGSNDFGPEAIETLLKGMEDNRDDLIVIVAGYPDLMESFLNSNPGLRSRFNKYISFQDYSAEEMAQIFQLLCKKNAVSCGEDCFEHIREVFADRVLEKRENFANGRDVRNYFEMAMINQANRLATMDIITDEDMTILLLEDVITIDSY